MERFDQLDADAIGNFMKGEQLTREDSIYLAQQLNVVKRRVYETETPNLTGLQLVPASSEVPEWADSYTTRIFDEHGIAKFISNYADDLPRADVSAKETTKRLKDLGVAYGYSTKELRQSQALGGQLPERKGRAARKAFDQKLNKVAIKGDVQYGYYGITNHPNIGETAVHGDWTNPATTGLQVLDDLNTLVDAIALQSFDNHAATTLAIAPKQRSVIMTKRVSDLTGETVYKAFREAHPNITIIASAELANVDGKSVAICYERDVDNLSIEIPRDFTQEPAEKRNLELVIDCTGTCGGVDIHRPLAITKAVGV